MPRYRLGVDTGGTFTDLCALDEASGGVVVTKVPSTPSNPSVAFMNGIRRLVDKHAIPPESIGFLIHGTTVATNAVLERKGAPTALLTTEGFEDVLHIGRQNRPRLYDFRAVRPAPLVPRNLRFGIPERVLHTGEVLRPLDEAKTREIIAHIGRLGIRSVAVCLLHAYANPVHERRIESILSEMLPEAHVTVSSEVLPEFREYERTSTVCINAYVMPKVGDYVADLEHRIRAARIASDLYVMQSNGGVITARTARRMSARTVLSGPAGGALTGVFLSRILDRPNVITIDMGGTSSDICLIEGGAPRLTAESEIGGYPVRLPMIDINTIGAGGGSIARIDAGGALRVGPESAGADPGPVCYGRGGAEPTVTDANLVLGRLSPAGLLGGEMPLDRDKAARAIEERVARPLGIGLHEAAQGILSVVHANMIRGIRRVSVERGHDPRDFILVPFGGAGPMHGVELARELNMAEIVIPPHPGIASAMGMLSADARHDFVHTHIALSREVVAERMQSIFEEMEARGREQLEKEGFTGRSVVLARSADMRYLRQSCELSVPVRQGTLGEHDLAATTDAFHRAHQKAYGYARHGSAVEFVNLRVTALGKLPEYRAVKGTAEIKSAPEPIGKREAIFAGRPAQTPVYRRDSLAGGAVVSGPAIVEQVDSTIVILPGCRAVADPYGNLHIRADRNGEP